MRGVGLRALVLTAALAGLLFNEAAAQSAQPSQSPPVAVSGWRYERGASDVHIFHCEQASCGSASSKVSYRLYPQGVTAGVTLEQFRREQENVVRALEMRSPPGTRIAILGIDGDPDTSVPRIYKSRRVAVAPNGVTEHLVSGMLIGARGSASLISSSPDETTTAANFGLFAAPLMLSLHMPGTRIEQK